MIQNIRWGVGGLPVDFLVVLEYSVLTTQRLLSKTANSGPASQNHIGPPRNISVGLNEQGDVFDCECLRLIKKNNN